MSGSRVVHSVRLLASSGVGMLLLGVTLALGFVVASQTIGRALVRMREPTAIRVKGYAEAPVTADRGEWVGMVTVRGEKLDALSIELDSAMSRLVAFARAAGFSDDEMSRLAVETSIRRGRDSRGNLTDEVVGYQLTQPLRIRSSSVARVLAISRDATQLLQDGIEVDSGRPGFTVGNLEQLKMELLGLATANGRARAELLARGSGGAVGGLLSASQGVFQITPVGSTEVSDYGMYDTSSIDKVVRAVVTLEFGVEK